MNVNLHFPAAAHTRVVAAASCLAISLAAGSARAQSTFNFLNECGTGVWSTSCNPSAGLFRNNWGQSASNSAALVYPGTLDTANVLAGSTLTLTTNVSIATLNVPVGATFNWTGGTMTTPTAGVGVGLLNSGTSNWTTFSRNFTGTLVNAAGASVLIDLNENNVVLANDVSWTNNGTLTFADGTDFSFLGSSSTRTLTNSGTLAVTNLGGTTGAVSVIDGWTSVVNSGVFSVGAGAGASFSSTAFSSVPTAVWTTASNSTFTFSGTTSGMFVGNHAGLASINNNVALAGDTTFALQAGSPNAWQWSGGAMNTGAFTLTNTGRMDWTAFSRSFTGTLVNAAGASILIDLNENNVSLLNAASWTNNGTLTFADGTDTNGSGTGTRTLTNSGTLAFINPAGIVGALTDFAGWSTISNTASGVIAVGPGAAASFTPTTPFALSAGRLEGLGRLNVGGTLVSSAVIAPGTGTGAAASDIGSLTIGTGRLQMTASSELEITLRNPTGSTQAADQTVDKLIIIDSGSPTPPAGANTLDGTLRVRFAPGTTDVQGGIDYVIVDVVGGGTSNLTGAFTQIIDANPLPGIRYSVRIVGNQAIMRVIRQCNISDVAGGNQEPLFDGQATADDIIVFLNRFFSGDLRADYAGANQSIGGDNQLTADDIIVFLSFYFQGCGF